MGTTPSRPLSPSTGSGTTNASDLTSGTVALARGGTGADLSATGGSGQVLKQTSAGGAVSVAAIAAGDLPTGIDAANIGAGSVSNTEFGYLDGVTSAIQTQLDAAGGLSQAADVSNGIEIYGVDSADKLTVAVDASGNVSLTPSGAFVDVLGRFRVNHLGTAVMTVYESGSDSYWDSSKGKIVIRSLGTSAIQLAANSLGFFSATPAARQTIAADLTDSTGGTPGTTLSAVSGSGDDSTINDNLATLNSRLKSLEDKIVTSTLMTKS